MEIQPREYTLLLTKDINSSKRPGQLRVSDVEAQRKLGLETKGEKGPVLVVFGAIDLLVLKQYKFGGGVEQVVLVEVFTFFTFNY